VVGADPTSLAVRVLRYHTNNVLKNNVLVTTTQTAGAGAYPSICTIDAGYFVGWVDMSYRGYAKYFDANDTVVGTQHTLFDHTGSRVFIGDQSSAYHNNTLYVTGYDQTNYDTFLRRLAR
jgi:hypothetical protein